MHFDENFSYPCIKWSLFSGVLCVEACMQCVVKFVDWHVVLDNEFCDTAVNFVDRHVVLGDVVN